MKTRPQQRGSILLMVIAVLTMIAMLGAAFITVAYLDSQQATATAGRSQTEPLMNTVVGKFAKAMVADCYLSNDTASRVRFTNVRPLGAGADPNGWLAFVDLMPGLCSPDPNWWGPTRTEGNPRLDSDPNFYGVPFCASATNKANPAFWPDRIPDFWLHPRFMAKDDAGVWDPNFFPFDRVATDGYPILATDANVRGDPNCAAAITSSGRFLYPTGVSNSDGDMYYMAASISDLSGKMSINHASKPLPSGSQDPSWAPITPMNINMQFRGLLDSNTAVDYLINTRTLQLPLKTYYEPVLAAHPFAPDPSKCRYPASWDPNAFLYPISEELSLRWVRPNSAASIGRMYNDIPSNPAANRQQFTARKTYLTTLSGGTIAIRWPDPNTAGLTRPIPLKVAAGGPLNQSDPNNQNVYRQMVLALLQLGATSGPDDANRVFSAKRMAASFVANLLAHQEPDANDYNKPWAFRPKDLDTGADEPWTVYGTRQELVITEAYASFSRAYKDTNNVVDANWAAGWAIEVWNPSNTKTYNLQDYRLARFDGTTLSSLTLPSYTIPRLARVVLYDCNTPATAITTTHVFNNATPSATWFQVNNLRFLRNSPDDSNVPVFRLMRIVDSTPANDVPIDVADANSFKQLTDVSQMCAAYLKDPNFGAATTRQWRIYDMRRDEDGNRCRYNMAVWATSGGSLNHPPTGTTYQTLGAGQLTSDATIESAAPYPVLMPAEMYANNIGSVDWVNVQMDPNYPNVRGSPLASIGQISQIHFAAPIRYGSGSPYRYSAFTESIMDANVSAIFSIACPSRGRIAVPPPGTSNMDCGISIPAATRTKYPDIPLACLLTEYFTVLTPDRIDSTDGNSAVRLYGRVNVNSAPLQVLACLPYTRYTGADNGDSSPYSARKLTFPYHITTGATAISLSSFDPNCAAEYLVAYRERRAVRWYPSGNGVIQRNYATRAGAAGSNIANLRGAAPYNTGKYFLSAGEVAVPLIDYMDDLIRSQATPTTFGTFANFPRNYCIYNELREMAWRNVSNVVTVNSDIYAINIVIQLRSSSRTAGAMPPRWYYLAIMDRGNVRSVGDVPSVLMLAPIPQ